MVKSVESALQVNILKISKAARQTHSNFLKLEWVVGCVSQVGVALLSGEALAVMVNGRTFQTSVSRREFRKDRFQPHIQCLACGRKCHILYVHNEGLQCRRCAGLIYESQRGHNRERALLKAQKAAARLKSRLGVPPARPAGMWRKTYRRLLIDLHQAQREFYSALRSKK